MAFLSKYRPALAMILVQVFLTVMLLLSKSILDKGMNVFVLVAYRHLVAAAVLAPFAYFWDRGTKLTIRAFGWIFVSASFGITLGIGLYYYGILYTSITLAAASTNFCPIMTFIIATIFRIEKLSLKSLGGRVKLIGTILCVSGAMLVTFYTGSSIKLLPSLRHFHQTSVTHSVKTNWIRGAIMLTVSCLGYSTWFVAQAKLMESYHARYFGIMLMCLIASAQSALVCFALSQDLKIWKLGLDLNLVTIVYSGLFVSAGNLCLSSWCVGQRGPTYATMFNPLVLVLASVTGSLFLGERLYIGSILGSIVIVGGLYTYLWGKNKEEKAKSLPQGEQRNGIVPVESEVADTSTGVNEGHKGAVIVVNIRDTI